MTKLVFDARVPDQDSSLGNLRDVSCEHVEVDDSDMLNFSLDGSLLFAIKGIYQIDALRRYCELVLEYSGTN